MGEKKRKQYAQGAAQNPAETPDVASSAMPVGARQWLATGLQSHRKAILIEAINAYQKALEYAPEQPDAQHYLGLALFQLGQRPLGIDLMRKSLSKANNNGEFHFNIGSALRTTDPAAALEHLEQAASLQPAALDFAIALAEVLHQLDQREEALIAWERAHALAPHRVETLRRLAEAYFECDQLELAHQRFQQALTLDPALARSCYIGFSDGRRGGPQRFSALDVAEDRISGLGDEATLRRMSVERDLHVVDDFLADPLAYRAHALTRQFQERRYAGQNYPGIQTDGFPCQEIMDDIATILGRKIKFMSPDNGSFRLSFSASAARTDIHVDNESGDNFNYYAGVLYLNLPEQCKGGTTFWKHLPTGWHRRPLDSVARAAGYAGFKTFQERWLPNTREVEFNKLKEQRAAWQPVLEVPMRHNRLILYRSDYFHSISEVFGTTPADGRLVQLFYFEAVDAPPPDCSNTDVENA